MGLRCTECLATYPTDVAAEAVARAGGKCPVCGGAVEDVDDPVECESTEVPGTPEEAIPASGTPAPEAGSDEPYDFGDDDSMPD